jgi:hypothetical protein
MAAHTYWRLYITEANGATAVDIAELEMRTTVGGANVCTGGTATASSSNGAQTADKALDGSISSTNTWQTSSFPTLPVWWKYQFAAPVDIVEVILKTGTFSAYFPKSLELQWSDDNSAWTTTLSATGLVPSGSGVTYTLNGVTSVPARVTAQSLEVLAVSAASVRITAQSLEVLTGTYEIRVPKAIGYAVLSSTGDTKIAISKAVGYAVLSSAAQISVAKAVGYAVLNDTTWVDTATRRRPVVALLG